MMKKTQGKNFPLISVVIPTYNSLRTIEKCLQSITNQTYKNFEIIVVDSKYYNKELQKRCEEVIKKFKARYILSGPERSIQRNKGIREAKGEFIAIIDQDMYLSKNILKECFEVLYKKDTVALTIPEISIGLGYWTKCVALDRYITTVLEIGANECCRFFRKKDALAVGLYNEEIVGAEDAEFHYKMGKIGRIGKIKEIIYHDEGKTKFWERVKKKFYYSRAFKKFVRRYPGAAMEAYFPLKLAYLKHWKFLLSNPFITSGIIALRSFEVGAGFLGLLVG